MPLYQSWWIWVLLAGILGTLLGALASFLMLQRRQVQLLEELDDMEEELKATQVRLDKTLKQIKAQSANLKSAFSGQTTMKAAIQVREDDLRSKTAELEQLRRAKAGLESMIRLRDRAVADLTGQLKQANAGLDALRKAQGKSEAAPGRDAELARIKGELDMARELVQASQEREEALQSELDDARRLVDDSEQKCTFLRAELSRANQERSQLAHSLSQLEARIQSVRAAPPAPVTIKPSKTATAEAAPYSPRAIDKRFADPETTQPLTDVDGIGATYEKRLYSAGITTFASLAKATPEQLDQICQAPTFRKPDYQDWIDQARRLVQETAATE